MMTTPPPRRIWPALMVFCLLAGLIPETIATFNNVVLNFIVAPQVLVFIAGFYGFADLLIREAMVRRRLGWGSVLLLGIAFGACNEGIAARTWYTVVPTGYILTHHIDFAWMVALTMFHSVISTVVPIALSNSLFPRIAHRSWVGNKGMVALGILFALLTSIGFVAPEYRGYQFMVAAGIVALTIIALVLPPAEPRVLVDKPVPGLWRLRVMGFFAFLGYFVLIYFIPTLIARLIGDVGQAQLPDIIVFLALFAGGVALLRRWTGRSGWDQAHTLALISGALSFGVFLSLFMPVSLAGLTPLVTIPFLVLLVWLARRQVAPPPGPLPSSAGEGGTGSAN